MKAGASRPRPAARRVPAAGFSCSAATLHLPSMNDVATPGGEASDDISDEALMLAYAAGRAGAFEQPYSRHRPLLYRFLLRQLRDGVLSDDLSDDICQPMTAASARWTPDASSASWLTRTPHQRLAAHSAAQHSRPHDPETPRP